MPDHIRHTDSHARTPFSDSVRKLSTFYCVIMIEKFLPQIQDRDVRQFDIHKTTNMLQLLSPHSHNVFRLPAAVSNSSVNRNKILEFHKFL